MTRKPEPSFSLKLIIWDIAATIGTDNYSAIYREVHQKLRQLHKNEELYEDETPDIRVLRRIVDLDIQRLSREVVVSKLPRHVWLLRNDYEEIIRDLEELQGGGREQGPTIEEEKQLQWQQVEHISQIQELARTAIDTYSTVLDRHPISQAKYGGVIQMSGMLDVSHSYALTMCNAFCDAFQQLVGAAMWPYFAEHLGSEAEEIKSLVEKFNSEYSSTIKEPRRLSLGELSAINDEAYQLLHGGLAVIAQSADTKEWERYGLKPICTLCSIAERKG
ncbi:hypothetical protein ACFLYR_06985 [Chloroflexota bacterium]